MRSALSSAIAKGQASIDKNYVREEEDSREMTIVILRQKTADQKKYGGDHQ